MKHALIALGFAALLTSPAAAQKAAWSYVDTGESVALTYAIPDSDDGGPSFHCTRGEGFVHILFFVEHRIATDMPREDGVWVDKKGKPSPWKGVLGVQSSYGGGAIKVVQDAGLAAEVTPDEMSGGSMLEAKVKPTAALLSAFSQGGVIKMSAYGETATPPPAPTDKVQALLKACAKPNA